MDPEQLIKQEIQNLRNLSKLNFELAEKTNDKDMKYYLMGKSDAYELAAEFIAVDETHL